MDKNEASSLEEQQGVSTSGGNPRNIVETYTDRTFLLKEHKAFEPFLSCEVPSSCLSSPTPKSHDTLDVKNRVNISELVVSLEKVPKGKFLLCRVIASWQKISAFSTVVEDPEGMAVRLFIYNVSSDLIYRLCPGSIIAVKDPWLKRNMDGGIGISEGDPRNFICKQDVLDKIQVEWKGEIPQEYRRYMPTKFNTF